MPATILTVANQKGGVAKTTTAVTIAHGLAMRNKRVLILDLDPQGQSATALGVNPEPCAFQLLIAVNDRDAARRQVRPTGRDNLSIIPGNQTTVTAQTVYNAEGRGPDAVASQLKLLHGDFDVIVIDTAPSVGGLQERAVWAARVVVIPTATEYLSSDGFGQMLTTIKRLQQTGWQGGIVALPTFYDETTRESATALDELRKALPVDGLFEPIHRATVLREAAAEGKTVWEFARDSRAAREYQAVLARVWQMI